MKQIFVLIACCIFWTCDEPANQARVDFNQSISFRNQEEIDRFLQEQGKVNSIKGNLRIGLTHSNIENLNGLKNIIAIQGNLEIESNPQLRSLKGLDNLKTIDGDLRITQNKVLSNIDQLEAISELGGNLIINNNASLDQLLGLKSLENINGAIFIASNPILKNVEGLNKVTSINGRLQITNNQNIENITALNNLAGIDSKTNAIADLLIYGNPKLSNCAITSICEALLDGHRFSDIENNSKGCNNREEIISTCIQGKDGAKYMERLKNAANLLDNEVIITSPEEVKLYILDETFSTLETHQLKVGDNRIPLKKSYKGIIYFKDENGKIRYITKQ